MRINLPGFSHANYIVFLIIQQEFPSPLAFNYILTRCFPPVPLWPATCGESLGCVIITGGRGQRCCRTTLELWKAGASSGFYMSQIYSFLQDKPLSFSGSSSRCIQCPPFWPILTHPYIPSQFHSTPSAVLRNRWHRAHKELQTPCPPQNQSKPTKQAMHTRSWCPDF